MKTKTMPNVRSCSVTECGYNDKQKCHAGAVTVDGPEPLCDTYFRSQHKGGVEATGTVGACKNDACLYNESYECAAPSIDVSLHGSRAECDTFTKKRLMKEAWDV
jgi:hypothetical protein